MKNLKLSGLLTLILLFPCLIGNSLFAQSSYTIKGEIIDSVTNKGAEYATVVILDKDGKPAASLISEATGKFLTLVKAIGDYTLTVSSIGYTSIVQPFKVEGQVTDLGKIEIVPGIEIESAVVSITKPIIRSDIDKIAYSVEADPDAPASTALDILRKVPLVSVDGDDNIYLQGQSNYKVLMNGKSSSLLSSNFKEMMRSMPASSIKDIEVITNPSSKYEAEGVGGIINIVTNRRNDVGYNGSIGLNANTLGQYGGYGYINAKIGKFTLSANAYAGHFEQSDNTTSAWTEYKSREDFKNLRSGGTLDAEGRYVNYQLEASYEIDTFNLITLSLWSNGMKYDMDRHLSSEAWDAAGNLVQSYTNDMFSTNKHNGLSGNIDYQRTFQKPDRALTLSYKLDSNPNESTTESYIDGILNYPTYDQRSLNDAHSWEHTFQVDYSEPISPKHAFEVGGKYILRQNSSKPETYMRTAANPVWTLDPSQQNDLDYDQHILGVYGAYTYKLNKWSFKAGARLESTWNDGVFTNEKGKTRFDNDQFNLIPYATVSYAPKSTNRYSLSYTQRLSRPGIWYLNPYVNNTDPNYWSTGNPNLDSEVSHQFNLTYGLFTPVHTLNLTANAAIVDNSIQRVTTVQEIDGKTVSLSTYENIGNQERYALNLYYSYRKGSAFSLSMNGAMNYMDISGPDNMHNHGWGFNGNGNIRVGLWKNGAVTSFVGYNSKRINLQGESSEFMYYGMGFNQQLFQQKMRFNVSLQFPFKKYTSYWSKLETPDMIQRSDQRQILRMVNFSLSYNFGKMNVQVKKARRGIQNDDLKAGENGGAGSTGASTGGGQ